MSLPSDFENELNALKREFNRSQPDDTLQFCANYFLKRLEAQRAESLLAHDHSSQKGSGAMAESNFPGGNPFVATRGGSTSSSRGMHALPEEEHHEHGNTSPTAPSFRKTQYEPESSSFMSDSRNESTHLPPLTGHRTFADMGLGRRTSVSAESMNPADTASENWTPPVYPKSKEQEARLHQAVQPNFLFSHLDPEQSSQVLGALQEKSIPAKGIKVISQGETGDFFYVVEKGSFDVFLNSTGSIQPGADGMGRKVAHIEAGGSFGELALMYNAPRAATVVSIEPSTIWALDRITFRRILMDGAYQRRQMYEKFLMTVPLLKDLTDYERSKIADALHTLKVSPGHTIIQEGDIGDHFYFLETGEAEVFKRGSSAPIHKYKQGDYFGELALMDNKPRAASVISKTDVKLALLSKEGFQRLLGPVADVMRRNDPSKRVLNEVDPLAKK